MRRRVLAMTGLITVAAASLTAQVTMNQVQLATGETDVNRLPPVYDGSQMASLIVAAFTSSYDKKQLFVRRAGGNMFTRGPEYRLNPSVDLGALLTESLTTQGKAMGLKLAAAGQSGWQLSGAIRDVYLESRQIPYGATLFYGYLDTDIQVSAPGGAKHTARVRLHNYCSGYNAGMGRRDEAESCAAQLLIEGAQELLARLNRNHFKAPPQTAMGSKVTALDAVSVDSQLASVRAIGLSGLPDATAALLTLLPSVKSESGRSVVIDALASLGAASAVAPLSARYATEDEDPRWYTLKAMDYIGGDEAMKFVAASGVKDKDTGPKRLADRIVKK